MSDPTVAPLTPPAWSAQSAVDPNSGAPIQPAAPLVPAQTAPNTETFEDMWKNAPDSTAPVRTFVDPSLRATPQGQFVDAWYDTPAATSTPNTNGVLTPDAATPLTGLISALSTAPGMTGNRITSGKQTATGYANENAWDGGPGGNSGGVGDAGTASAGDAGNGDGGNGGVGDGSGVGGDSGTA